MQYSTPSLIAPHAISGRVATQAIKQVSLDEITIPSGRQATDSSRVQALAGAMEATQ